MDTRNLELARAATEIENESKMAEYMKSMLAPVDQKDETVAECTNCKKSIRSSLSEYSKTELRNELKRRKAGKR